MPGRTNAAGLAIAGGLIAIAVIISGPAAAGSPAGAKLPAGTATGVVAAGGANNARAAVSKTPSPPRLPGNFNGKGRYIVGDLGVDVPFTFRGRKGNMKMVAGGRDYPIWFMNLIYKDHLYTVVYRWPGLVSPRPCSKISDPFSRKTLNGILSRSRFVGREILQGNPRRYVNHFRVSSVLPLSPPGETLRIPIALGDVYVDQNNPKTWWQGLQFGLQNLFDPELDEWFRMDTFKHRPGKVKLPNGCKQR